MRTTIRRPRLAMLLLALLAAAGCASGSGGWRGADTDVVEEGAVAVTVNNNLVPPATLTIYIVSDTGTRRRLGAVSPSRTETFSFESSIATATYRLVAEVDAGRDIASNPFTLTNTTAGLTWNLQANLISFR